MIRTVGVLIVCLLPLVAFAQQDWQSTSVMQGSGSTYSPQVTEVGATSVVSEATTTESYSPAKAPGGPRRTSISNDEDEGWTPRTDTEGTDLSPIGDAVLPLMLMAVAFCGVVYFRRRRALSR